MFDPIKSHIDHYRGPATGMGTDHGDTWPTAVDKINKGFDAVVKWIESFDPDVKEKPEPAMTPEEIGNMIQQAVTPLQDEIAALRLQVEAANAELAIVRGFFEESAATVEGNAGGEGQPA